MLLSASFTCLDACCCHGLRLPVFNKETTYLLYLLVKVGLLCPNIHEQRVTAAMERSTDDCLNVVIN